MSSPNVVERNQRAPSCSYSVAAAHQALDRLVDPAIAVQRALGLPDVEVDAEPLEGRLDPGADALGRPSPEDLRAVRAWSRGGGRDVVGHGGGEVADVVAVVAVLGDRLPVARREHGRAELPHLGTEVVEVVLARHVCPPASRTRLRRSPTNAPRALPMCSGPVGFADTNSTSTRRGSTPAGSGPSRSGSARMRATIASYAASATRRLTNPGPRDVGRGDQVAVRTVAQRGGERLGDVEGRTAERSRELHREVGREVAEGRVRGPLDPDRRVAPRRPRVADSAPVSTADAQARSRHRAPATGSWPAVWWLVGTGHGSMLLRRSRGERNHNVSHAASGRPLAAACR